MDLEESEGLSDVSSVHTSDLSNFEDSDNSDVDSDLEALQSRLAQLQRDKEQASRLLYQK